MPFYPQPKPLPRQRPKHVEFAAGADTFPDFEADDQPAFQPDSEPGFEPDIEAAGPTERNIGKSGLNDLAEEK